MERLEHGFLKIRIMKDKCRNDVEILLNDSDPQKIFTILVNKN